jgi:hypothetical protein
MKYFSYSFAVCLLVLAGCTDELIIEQEEPTPLEEETPVQYSTIYASFDNPDTRTYLELEENGAKVFWSKGDRICAAYDFTDLDYTYLLYFTTEDDGVSTASFTAEACDPPGEVSRCLAVYPSSTKMNAEQAAIYVPTRQQAVKGGIEEGLNLAYATSSTFGENMVFKNALALLQFRLSGDVSKVSSIKFVANSTIAGEGLIEDLDNDEPTYNMSSYFPPIRESRSNSIFLEGPFEENEDYLIATIPCTTEGFSMIFIDEDGNYSIKQSSKTLSLKRSNITNFGTINVSTSADISVYKYSEQTVGSNPVDIAVLPDGFTISDRRDYEARAEAALDYMFSVEPYASLKDYFNVYIMWTPSTDKGASITDGSGNITTQRNTAFGSRWGKNSYDDMEADEDKVYGYVSTHCPEIVRGELTIDEVPILLVINDERYGGRAHTSSSGRTYCQAPYASNGGELGWAYSNNGIIAASNDPANGFETRNVTDEEIQRLGTTTGDWRNIVLHEFGGHSIGRFADEYWGRTYYTVQTDIPSHNWRVPYSLNVSGRYDVVPWQDLLDQQSELVGRDSRYNRIGRFQGAGTYLFNYWRSEEISCMIDNRPYFSTWQRALITKRIMEMAGEEFNLDSFLNNDNPNDPIRDNRSATKARATKNGPVMIMPPLAPPELKDDNQVPVTGATL